MIQEEVDLNPLPQNTSDGSLVCLNHISPYQSIRRTKEIQVGKERQEEREILLPGPQTQL